jgi:hypothetical protein
VRRHAEAADPLGAGGPYSTHAVSAGFSAALVAQPGAVPLRSCFRVFTAEST